MHDSKPSTFNSATRPKRLQGQHVAMGKTVALTDDYSVKTNALKHISSVITDQMKEAQSEAGQILAQAQQEAAEIIAQAKRDAEDLLTEAALDTHRQEAYEIGYQAGHQAITELCQHQVALSNGLLKQAQDTHTQWLEASKETQLLLAKRLAELILHEELNNEPKRLKTLLLAAQESLMGQLASKPGIVHVHPDSLAALQNSGVGADDLTHLEFRTDPKYPKGRIYLDTSETSWDISPSSQLDSWIETLKATLSVQEAP